MYILRKRIHRPLKKSLSFLYRRFYSDSELFAKMLSKRKLGVDLLHEFKLSHSAVKVVRSVTNAWSEDITSECSVRRWFKKFRAGGFSIECREGRGRLPEVDSDELKPMVGANQRASTRGIAEEVGHATVARNLKVKNSVSGCRMSWPRISNFVVLKCDSLFIWATKAICFWGILCA